MLLTPTGFLRVGGAILLILGIVGYSGVTNNIEAFQLDAGENLVHTVLGVVGLALGFGIRNIELHRYVVIALLVLGAVATVWGIINPSGPFVNGAFTRPNAGFTNLENPADTVLHAVVTVWILAVLFLRQPTAERAAAGRA
jgi:hypothetical protein